MSEPRFSVLIPCYNRPALLARALESCLAQTFSSFEVIVVDDASEVDVLAEAERLRPDFERAGIHLRCTRRAVNSGAAVARNDAWGLARGEYVAFLDADDIWHPSKLDVVHAALAQFSTDGAFHGFAAGAATSTGRLTIEDFQLARVGCLQGLLRNFSATPCFALRREVPERFDESMRYLEDHDLWLRVSRRTPLLRLVGPPLTWLGRAPNSAGGLSADRWRMRRGEMRVYRNFCRGTPWMAGLPLLIAWSLFKHGCGVLGAALDRPAHTQRDAGRD